MFSNNKKQGGCGCGCGGSCGRSGGQNNCQQLGPFLAIDRACIVPGVTVNTGSIIPFSSGVTPVTLATLANGLVGVPQQIGFGSSVPGIAILGNTIDLSTVITEAFSVPRAGNITAISASFSVTTAIALLAGTATINAQIYKAPAGSTLFTATDASINLTPSLTGPISVGQTVSASSDLAPIPVAQGERLVMLFSISGTGITVITTVIGTASAGITIE